MISLRYVSMEILLHYCERTDGMANKNLCLAIVIPDLKKNNKYASLLKFCEDTVVFIVQTILYCSAYMFVQYHVVRCNFSIIPT